MEDIRAFHNSHKLEYRNPFGAVKVGTTIKISIELNKEATVYIHTTSFKGREQEISMDNVFKNQDGSFLYTGIIDTSNSLGLLNYYFKIIYNNDVVYYGNNNDILGGIGQRYDYRPKLYQITVYNERPVPDWYKEGIIYQIFVDRFLNGNEKGEISSPKKNSFIYATWEDEPMYIKNEKGNIARWDFYGGNLKGVKEKLEYIKSLGASIIYMNPIFEAVSCHKYDTGDYKKIDGMFGTEKDFKVLCEEAKKLGIRIILDGVFSHTGSDSKYFNKLGTYKNEGAYQSKESRYYNWYRFNKHPNEYECWWGFDNQPNINELNDDYVNYIIKDEDSVIAKWMKLGASGWRLDVADELPDKFIQMIKEKMLEVDEKSVLIGEVWEDASNKISYSDRREYFFGKELDSVTNYPFRDIVIGLIEGNISSDLFIKKLMSLLENYPTENFYSSMNLLGNHDTERIFTKLSENMELLKLAIVIQMTIPGVPLIYYGDEVGLLGGRDPQNRRPYPWNKQNKEILNWYKVLGNIRSNEVSLKKGSFKPISISSEVLAYEREYKSEKILVLVNTTNRELECKFKGYGKNLIGLIDKTEGYEEIDGEINIKMCNHGVKIIKLI
ncbi:glycoside hydrolase family 13 protein [Clostridium gasigenes]|uniref:glycoside hydrolase family 13 protein n=1 Tax=Clostridium gasigenes TaxID=94869 RepID=UPI0014382909|nr:glycoside hydrolase family 13 protein [Clostridium gasigenes]NKF08809.1 glycoside hydrolase family 13 protein [Clostridium gasigenes]QSW20854.1 glycoside hydrolase family 13 protein [Clostridium gasigenes]